jgi:hypothetical protein
MSNVPLPQPYTLAYLAARGLNRVLPGDDLTPIIEAMHAHAAAVSAADNAALREVLEFIAEHDLNGADDRAKAIICGLFILKSKAALKGASHE